MAVPTARALSRQQRRALERRHQKVRRALAAPVSRLELHHYFQNQRAHRRVLRWLAKLPARALAFLRAPVHGPA